MLVILDNLFSIEFLTKRINLNEVIFCFIRIWANVTPRIFNETKKKENILFGILLLIFMPIIIPNKLQGVDLNQYLWKNRIIITLAKDEDHPDLMRLKAEMKENKCEILNRDLLHFNFINDHEIKNLTTLNDKSF